LYKLYFKELIGKLINLYFSSRDEQKEEQKDELKGFPFKGHGLYTLYDTRQNTIVTQEVEFFTQNELSIYYDRVLESTNETQENYKEKEEYLKTFDFFK
jgi:hypothetical protein